MRDNDLKDFFEEDAYNELLNIYAKEEEAQKEKHSILADVHLKSDVMPKEVPPRRNASRSAQPTAPVRRSTERQQRVQAPPAQPQARPASRVSPVGQSPSASVKKQPPAAPASHSAPEKFQLHIQGLDEEFQAPNGNPPPRQPKSAGAFADFSEVVRKRRAPKDPAAGNFMVTDLVRDNPPAAQILKSTPRGKLDAETVKAFLVKNKNTWILLLICLVASIVLATYSISCLNDIFALRRDSETVVTVNIPANADTKTVLKILQDNDLIQHRHFSWVIAKMMNFRDDNYLTGVYYVTASMGMEKMLSTFKEATNSGATVTLTFPEGYTADQIIQKLEKYEVCSAAALYQAMQDVDFSSEFPFIADMDDKAARYRLLEGYLYPDTYEFYINESPSSVLRKFLNNFHKRWTEEYAAQAEKIGMSVDDVVTLASIIQKEAYGTEQTPLVSSVLHNRLDKSGLYPSLQCDSSEAYIKDYIKANVKDATQLAKYTNAYSTYKCAGLPLGAICNPGDDAIRAALYPKKTGYYFFAHDVNKKLYLAKNDKEHDANRAAISRVDSEAKKKNTQ